MNWIVYTYAAGATPPCHAYGSYNESAGDKAGEPFDQQTAEELAANINQFGDGKITAMALPLEQTLEPGV